MRKRQNMKANNMANFKAKHSAIAPEDVIVDKPYSFSFNPESQPLFTNFYTVKLNNLQQWSEDIKTFFTSLRYCDIVVYMECSRSGRMHFHGKIIIYSVIEFYMTDLKRLKDRGTYEIDHITDEAVWDAYCTKQLHYMRPYAEKHQMEYLLTV